MLYMKLLKEATGQMPRLIGAAQTTQAKQVTTFNSSGTLTTQPQTTAIEYLVVAGGGGGAAQANGGGGGGGAGGFRTGTGNPVSGNSPYPVTVGGRRFWIISTSGRKCR